MDDPKPRSDDEIGAAHVGQPEILDGPITLVGHDDTWRALYAREADRIRRALGDRARSIQHVGSTAVPGLAAKPRIDMVVEVADTDDEDRYLLPLEALGYVLSVREPDWHRHRGLKHTAPDVNLHVSRRGASRSSGWCGSAIVCAATRRTEPCTSVRSESSPGGRGGTCSTTRTRRPP